MREALKEGRKALPGCKPNPPVGCILVCQQKIIARGHTQPPGKDHAEAMAIKACPVKDFSLVTAFVTLEPCSFAGKTPACAKTFIAKGIKRVYVALEDPHPQNRGQGFKLMREAGIEVQVGILAAEALGELKEHLIY